MNGLSPVIEYPKEMNPMCMACKHCIGYDLGKATASCSNDSAVGTISQCSGFVQRDYPYEMRYRKMALADLPKWEELAKDQFSDQDFCSAEYLSQQWNETSGWVLLTKNDEWVGCVFASPKMHDYKEDGIQFYEICTFPGFRKKGLARLLMKILFDNYPGVQKSLCIDPANTSSINLATKYGFKKAYPCKSWDVYICDKSYYPQEFIDLSYPVESSI
jgi:ribosomal protein S18 acetylase RimI-like enzyme